MSKLLISQNGRLLFGASYDKSIYVWSVNDKKLIYKLEKAHEGLIPTIIVINSDDEMSGNRL